MYRVSICGTTLIYLHSIILNDGVLGAAVVVFRCLHFCPPEIDNYLVNPTPTHTLNATPLLSTTFHPCHVHPQRRTLMWGRGCCRRRRRRCGGGGGGRGC